MRTTLSPLAGLVLALTASAVEITDVRLSQRWPFSPLVDVCYTLSGVEGSVDVASVVAYSGETSLGAVPEAAMCGARHGLTADGTYHFAIDPSKCSFAADGIVPALSVALEATASQRTDFDDVLYKIVTLSGSTFPVVNVTVREILDGEYGTYETDPPWIQSEVKARHEKILFVTGFTNDTVYATDKLVLRRIPSGTYTVGKTGSSTPLHTVTLAKDFWIGIFELTQKQWQNAYGTTISCDYPGDCRPLQSNVSYDMIRGYSGDAASAAYNWPSGKEIRSSSFMGALRQKTGLPFDLPTRREWLVAASAGAYEARCYDGSTPTKNDPTQSGWYLGRNASNSNSTGYPLGGSSNVGRYRANAYGLYDTLGNVAELVLDWVGESIASGASFTDPEGPTSGSQRMSCGCHYNWSLTGGMTLTDGSSGLAPGNGSHLVGFRVAIR